MNCFGFTYSLCNALTLHGCHHIENNTRGTLKNNSSRAGTQNKKEPNHTSWLYALYILWSPKPGSERGAPTWAAFSAPSAAPLLLQGRGTGKSCREVHLQSSHLCPAFIFAPTELKSSGWSVVNTLPNNRASFLLCGSVNESPLFFFKTRHEITSKELLSH